VGPNLGRGRRRRRRKKSGWDSFLSGVTSDHDDDHDYDDTFVMLIINMMTTLMVWA